jgi:hypothetical protein
MKDMGLPIELGSGVAAAQQYYRNHSMIEQKVAAE